MSLTVVTFKWGTKYTAAHVNRLRRMVDQFYSPDSRMICVTNQPEGINPRVEILADTEDFAHLQSPAGKAFPSCYRRLRIWHKDAAQWFGERFVCIDLDVTAVADLTPLWDRPEPIVMYRDPYHGHKGQYCGSMVLLTAGAFPDAWHTFDPGRGMVRAGERGFRGSDQAWLSYVLPAVPTWGPEDGVYSYKAHCRQSVPNDARLVVFHGEPKPWTCGQEWAG